MYILSLVFEYSVQFFEYSVFIPICHRIYKKKNNINVKLGDQFIHTTVFFHTRKSYI